ncbi:hypothetical protein BH09PSE5_BH09PSE5_09470 [soil metagenome]
MTLPEPPVPGWYGKLPSLGDFATRRLSTSFVDCWDAWLSVGLAALKLQPSWPDRYLYSPSWRFVLMPGALPGALGDAAWCGVLMPSVDSVGRYFPLTVAVAMDTPPSSWDDVEMTSTKLDALDDAAADALYEDWTVDAFEQALARTGSSAPAFAESDAQWQMQMRGKAIWHAAPAGEPPRALVSDGVTEAGLAERLFGLPGQSSATDAAIWPPPAAST